MTEPRIVTHTAECKGCSGYFTCERCHASYGSCTFAAWPERVCDRCAADQPHGRFGDWMQTFTGKAIWPLDPRPEDIDLVDIAHALSNICRFAGHVREFYSVAQHSVLVALHCPEEIRAEALVHDGTEYALCDLPRPIKINMVEYREAEHRYERCMSKHFGFPQHHPSRKAIKHHDLRALYTERRDLMGPGPMPWTDAHGPASEPWDYVIEPWSPRVAFSVFLMLAYSLGLSGSRYCTHAEAVLAEEWLAKTTRRIHEHPGWPCSCSAWNAAAARVCIACGQAMPGTRLPGDTDAPVPERVRFDLPGDTPSPTKQPFALPGDTPVQRAFQNPGGPFGLPSDRQRPKRST